MYVKKSVLAIGALLLILATVVLTVGAINPFGFTAWEELIRFSLVTRLVSENYYKELEPEIFVNTALQGIAAATGDPYTAYLWGEEAEEYMSTVTGNYQGVGIYIENCTEDNTIRVVSAIAGSPAEEAGIAAGDRILKINGEVYTGEQLHEASTVMRGMEGTEVTLILKRQSTGREEEITLERRGITLPSVESRMQTEEIGVIAVHQFVEGTSEEFSKAYRELQQAGMKQLVLDLRNNPGGYLNEAIEVADFFLEEGQLVTYTLDRKGRRKDYSATENGETLPMVVLSNQGTASAAENLIGALKEHEKAYHIGEKTYGKGVVQNVYPMEDGVLSVTAARYYTPDGECIHKKGILPDAEVAEEETGSLTDMPMEAAVEYLTR